MKATIVSLMVTLLLILGMYVFYFKSATGGAGVAGSGGSVIANTSIQMDLTALAEAERIYYVTNGSYGTVDQLLSSGMMDKLSKGRDGYAYSAEASETGFTVTARHDDESGGKRYPILTINEKMEIRHDGETVPETIAGTPGATAGAVPVATSAPAPGTVPGAQ